MYNINNLCDGSGDLHMHTKASDGTIDVRRRVELARERDLDAIAITDHDVIPTVLDTPIDRRSGLEIITGVEVRADIYDTKIEILGYFFDPTDSRLQEMLDRARTFRQERNAELISNLNREVGLELSYDDLASSTEGELGRPHLADVLVERGFVDSVGEAFDTYLAENGSVFVPMERMPAKEVLETIHDAGGVTSLAHPGRIRGDTDIVVQMVDRLAELGLDGIEVKYPYSADRSDRYADVDVEKALQLAKKYELIPTGGSDCHGPKSGKFRCGSVRLPAENVRRLKERSLVR